MKSRVLVVVLLALQLLFPNFSIELVKFLRRKRKPGMVGFGSAKALQVRGVG